MNKIEKNKNQILEVMFQLAAKRFSTFEKIVLMIIIIILGFIGNNYFNNWINELKNKNSVVITVSPPIKPKLPDPIIVKQVNQIEESILPEVDIPELRDPFLSSKNPQELKAAAVKKPAVELKLSGILWDDNIPSAIINSNIVKIGDLIEEKTVVDIEKNRVIMMEDGKILVIELRKQ